MRWSYINRTDLVGIQCTNPYKGVYQVALTPNPYSSTGELEEQNTDTRYISVRVENQPTVESVKQLLINLQEEYDTTQEVNGFTFGDRTTWLSKADRVGLVNSVGVKKRKNATYIELWLGIHKVNVDLTYAEEFLDELELYAMTCYNLKAKHIAEINQLTTLEELLAYDITADYPPHIAFDLTKIVPEQTEE